MIRRASGHFCITAKAALLKMDLPKASYSQEILFMPHKLAYLSVVFCMARRLRCVWL